jgi:hypothetical protein
MVTVHTECLGHITRDFYSINQALKQFFSWLNWFRLLWRNEERLYYQDAIKKY